MASRVTSVADLAVGQLLGAEQLAQELQQAADGVVVALGAGRARAQVRGDLHEQIHVAGEHGIDLDEVLFGDLVAAVPVQLQIAAVLAETARARAALCRASS